jgi:hypothetical protein
MQAKCIVICWSKNSSASRWVRDEADVAVKRGVAIPVSLDGSLPPLGFGQFHTLNVSMLVGEKSAELPEVIDNIRKTINGGRVVALASGILFRPGEPWSKPFLTIVGTLVIGALIVAATFSVYALQEYAKPTAPTKFSQLKKAELLMSEVDDFMTVIVNDKGTFRSQFGEASDWIDVTKYFTKGANKISLTITNGLYGGCGGRLELRMNGFVAPDYMWSYGTATGITENRPPNVMCYAQVKTIVLE